MKLTRELIESGRTKRGSFNFAQLKAIGVKLPGNGQFPARGWIERLEGTEVTKEAFAEFLRLANAPREERRQMLRKERSLSL